MDDEERIENAVRNTQIIRAPKQTLSAFGMTNTYYYIITEPSYAEPGVNETVVREGRVITEKPRIVTPYYLTRLEGFSQDARKYFDILLKVHGANAPGLLYTYRNEPKELNIVSDDWRAVAERLNAEIDRRGDPLTSIIKGQDDLWDVSLLKFIYQMTRDSLQNNFSYFGSRGLLNIDASGVPFDARLKIEELFSLVLKGQCETHELKNELDRWNVFNEYQDRFLSIFKTKR